jgi:hypothetical protein
VAVADVWDMTRGCDRGGSYECMRRMGDGENDDCEHWAEGAHSLMARLPKRAVSANVTRRAYPYKLTRTENHDRNRHRLFSIANQEGFDSSRKYRDLRTSASWKVGTQISDKVSGNFLQCGGTISCYGIETVDPRLRYATQRCPSPQNGTSQRSCSSLISRFNPFLLCRQIPFSVIPRDVKSSHQNDPHDPSHSSRNSLHPLSICPFVLCPRRQWRKVVPCFPHSLSTHFLRAIIRTHVQPNRSTRMWMDQLQVRQCPALFRRSKLFRICTHFLWRKWTRAKTVKHTLTLSATTSLTIEPSKSTR